jgi:hypothetical protein
MEIKMYTISIIVIVPPPECGQQNLWGRVGSLPKSWFVFLR